MVVVDGQLSDVARHAHRQAPGGVVVAEEDIGNGCAALASGVVGREECIGLLGSPSLIQRAPFYIHYHEALGHGAQGFEQLLLAAKQVERGAVEAFAAFHIAYGGRCVDGSRAGGFVAGAEVARAGAAYAADDDVGPARCCHGCSDIVVGGVADGTAADVFHLPDGQLGADAFEDGRHGIVGLRGGVVAELVVLAVGVRPADEHAEVFGKGEWSGEGVSVL